MHVLQELLGLNSTTNSFDTFVTGRAFCCNRLRDWVIFVLGG